MNLLPSCSQHTRPQRRIAATLATVLAALPLGTAPLEATEPTPGRPPAATPLPSPPEVSDAALADAWARVLLRSNPGPFQYAAYEVTARGSAGVASHTLGVEGRRDAIVKTELMARTELITLLQRLRELGGWELAALPPPRPVAPPPARKKPTKGAPIQPSILAAAEADPLWTPERSALPIYEISLRLGGVEHTILATDPFVQRDRRYAQVIGLIRDAAVRTAGEIGFPGTTGSSRAGYVYVDSTPSARVYIDGVLAQETTPLLNWSLSPGKHLIEFELEGQPARKQFPVVVRPGLTTSVEVDLRE